MKRVQTCIGIAALAVAGCAGGPDSQTLWEEHFEESCDGTPCGWAQISDESAATAQWVETLPGDHGLQLTGDGVAVRVVPDVFLPGRSVQTFSLVLRATARCDLGDHLEVRVTVELTDGRTLTFQAEVVPEATWSTLLPDQSMVPLDPIEGPWFVERILGVSVRKGGEGSCELDHLALRAPFGF